MRWQCEKVMAQLDKCQGHFKLLADLSEGGSPYIEKHVANMVALFDMARATVKTFREGL